MFLETERLILREFEEKDFEDFLDYAKDPEMCRMMGEYNLSDPAAARRFFDHLKNEETRAYALILKDTDRLVGNLTVCLPSPSVLKHRFVAGKNGRKLSFSISRRYRRQGLVIEAASHVIERLFLIEGIDYISCGYFSFNTPSRELQKKLGFTKLLVEPIVIDGETIDSVENILFRT